MISLKISDIYLIPAYLYFFKKKVFLVAPECPPMNQFHMQWYFNAGPRTISKFLVIWYSKELSISFWIMCDFQVRRIED